MAISRSYDGQIVDVTSDDNDPDAKVEPESSEEEEYNDDDEEEIIGDFIDEDEKEEMRVAHDSKLQNIKNLKMLSMQYREISDTQG